jgi:hypothetical protein
VHKRFVADDVSGGIGDEGWAIPADSNSRGSIVLEPIVVSLQTHVRACQARRAARHQGARMHPERSESWPNPGIATTESDASTRASVLLDQKQT